MRRCFGENDAAYSDACFESLSVMHNNGGNFKSPSLDCTDVKLCFEDIVRESLYSINDYGLVANVVNSQARCSHETGFVLVGTNKKERLTTEIMAYK